MVPEHEVMALGLSACADWTTKKFMFSAHCPTTSSVNHHTSYGIPYGIWNKFYNQIIYRQRPHKKLSHIPPKESWRHNMCISISEKYQVKKKKKPTIKEPINDLNESFSLLVSPREHLAQTRNLSWIPFSFLLILISQFLQGFSSNKPAPNLPSPPEPAQFLLSLLRATYYGSE